MNLTQLKLADEEFFDSCIKSKRSADTKQPIWRRKVKRVQVEPEPAPELST